MCHSERSEESPALRAEILTCTCSAGASVAPCHKHAFGDRGSELQEFKGLSGVGVSPLSYTALKKVDLNREDAKCAKK